MRKATNLMSVSEHRAKNKSGPRCYPITIRTHSGTLDSKAVTSDRKTLIAPNCALQQIQATGIERG